MNFGEEHIAIKAENITKVFGDFTAVDHISFEVKKGEIFGFFNEACKKSPAYIQNTQKEDCF